MITLDDKYRFNDFGLVLLEGHDHPITPILNRKTMHIPGRSGQWDFGTEIREKYLSIPLATESFDRTKLQYKFNQLNKFLFDEHGKPREFKITFDYEPDKYYMAKISNDISPTRIRPFSRFVLELVINDPFKYSKHYANEVTWGSEEITFESEFLLGHTNDFGGESVHVTSTQSFNITVSGIAVQPIIHIEGSANNLNLSANGHSFSLPNFVNETWEIDVNRYVAFRNNQETIIDIREFFLLPGDNVISVTGDNIDIELSVKFRDKYN